MYRNANGTGLVSYRSSDTLPDPPGGVGTEFVAPSILKLLYGPDEANIPFLDKIKEGNAVRDILLGYANHQAQVCFSEVPFRCFCFRPDIFKVGFALTAVRIELRQEPVVTRESL